MRGVVLAVLVIDAMLLAAAELLFMPLHIGSVPFPVTVVVAAVTTPWLVRSAAEVGGGIGMAAAPLVAWFVAIGVLGLAGPGHDMLLVADWRSILLLGAGIAPAAWVLGKVMRVDGGI